jgi:hypothetical protein
VALPNLAAAADLSTRGVDVSNTALVAEMLAVASSVVREAAQSPILSTTSTVDVWAHDGERLLPLPGVPVTAVSSVVYDGDTLVADDDFKLVGNALWRSSGWGSRYDCEPLKVTVTLTHGFAVVPASIKHLVCDVAVAGLNAAADGARTPGVVSERIDDYAVTFAQGAEAVATAVELPQATKNAVRKRFGGGAALVVSR